MISLLLLISLFQGHEAEKIVCNGVIFNHVYFDRQVLVSNFDRPYNLVMHKFSGLLFFSHTVRNGTHTDFLITACHIDKKICSDVRSVPGGYAIAYDAGNDDVYLGGHDGIYKYNFLTKTAEYFAEEGKSIWSLFIKRNFYYIEYPSQKLLVYQDDDFLPVNEAKNFEIDHFFISKYQDVYFSNRTALYKVEKAQREPIVISDEIVVRQIVEDSYGDTYFCGSDGIYVEDKPYHRIKKVAHIEQAFGLTFDEHDQIVYSNEHTIYRLRPSKFAETCYKALVNHKIANEIKILRETLIS